MRTRTLLLLATSLTVCTIASCAFASGGAVSPEHVHDAGVRPSSVVRASQVLAAWDRARATAWAHGSPVALADLYTASSATATRDVAALRRWRLRGLRVVGLRQQVTTLRVLVERPRRLEVVATERTVDAIAVGRHRRTALPVSAWATHRIGLRHVDGRWLVAEVVAQPAR